MSGPTHIELQAALDAERAKCVALQAEIERLRGLLSREQQERHAALAEVDRITEAGRMHIRRAAAFEAQRDELAARLAEIEAQPPVAVIGDTYSLLWAQPGTMPEIVSRCGIKVGSLLYARPVPAAAPWPESVQGPVRLTDEQIERGRCEVFSVGNPFCPCDAKTMRKAVRWAETAILRANNLGTAASERAEPAADLEALVAEMLACLRLSRGNVASLGPAMAIEPHTPYRPWLAELDRVIAKVEGGTA